MRQSILAFAMMALSSTCAGAAPAAAPKTVIVSASPAAPDAATVAEAMRLLDAENFEQETLRTSALAVDTMAVGTAERLQKSTTEEIPADFIAQLKQMMHDHALETIRSNMPSIKRQAAEIFAQQFTRDELVRLRQIESDPLMIKLRDRRPAMEPKLMMIGIRTMRAAEPELQAKMKRLITDYIARHPELAPKSTS